MDANVKNVGLKVVRVKGDYVVGRQGIIVDFDEKKGRYQVSWFGSPKTWVKSSVISLI